jgi:hypothetical protein
MMSSSERLSRRGFLGTSVAAVAATGATLASAAEKASAAEAAQPNAPEKPAESLANGMPYGMLGKAKISRLMLGGNLVTGCMHSRDLHYVNQLFRAYVTEEKLMQTLKVAEENGINTVFESGAGFVHRYNKEFGGHMQIIPSIHPEIGQDERKLKDEIKGQVDAGVPALYVWGAAGDTLVKAGEVRLIAKAVEFVKAHGIPAGVGGHSLLVPMACEKEKIPCDFYVKTFHSDEYPSATPKELRKDFMWLDGGKGFYDNMWCINAEETIQFMRTVTKPWVAFKILAAGAILPRQGFSYAFRNGADFIAVGMFDFQIKANCELARQLAAREKNRVRPWRA